MLDMPNELLDAYAEDLAITECSFELMENQQFSSTVPAKG